MDHDQLPNKIRKVASELDNAVESKNIELILSSFCDDCEIELLGTKLTGKEGARRWAYWLYKHLAEVRFLPITIMVDGNRFFEEFILAGKLHNGIEVQSKQTEVLIYENYKIKSLRLYFDRLDFVDSVVRGSVSKAFVRQLVKRSLKGLI